jgi:hypothetical protein
MMGWFLRLPKSIEIDFYCDQKVGNLRIGCMILL